MSDDKPKSNGNGEPPKISLNGKANGNGNGNGKSDTGPVPSSADAPPKVQVPVGRPSEAKAATSRIDLNEATPAADQTRPAEETGPIPMGIPAEAKSQTSRIDLSAASTPTGAPPRTGIPAQRKSDTAKISLGDSHPAGGTKQVDVTRPVDLSEDSSATSPTSTAPVSAAGIDQTTPVDQTAAISTEIHEGPKTPMPIKLTDFNEGGTMPVEGDGEPEGDDQLHASIDESYKAAHQSTMRIELDDQAGGKTSSATSSVEPSVEDDKASGTTARIDLSEVLNGDGDDVFKRRTGPVEAEEGLKPVAGGGSATGTPKTIRIKKADAPPPTRILQRPPHAPDTVAEEKAPKSGTSPIDVGEEAEAGSGPPTQRKTIRIKRPESGAGAKPMTVARPAESGKKKGRKSRQKQPGVAPRPASVAGAPGVAYTIITGLAVLVLGVVVYVLAAQLNSIALGEDTKPSLPYYGRIL